MRQYAVCPADSLLVGARRKSTVLSLPRASDGPEQRHHRLPLAGIGRPQLARRSGDELAAYQVLEPSVREPSANVKPSRGLHHSSQCLGRPAVKPPVPPKPQNEPRGPKCFVALAHAGGLAVLGSVDRAPPTPLITALPAYACRRTALLPESCR